MAEPIGNPLTWTVKVFDRGARHVAEGAGEIGGAEAGPIGIAALSYADLTAALRAGFEDFKAFRTDVIFLVVIYPILGALLTRLAVDRELLPLVFPLLAGFALLGPVAAIGLYELSRRRERGLPAGWLDAFGVMSSPSFVPMLALGGLLVGLFLVWMFAAWQIYAATLGPEPPASLSAFVESVFATGAGWAMLVAGMAVGFGFAALALAVSLVSFPLLLDRHVGLPTAIVTSVRVALGSPGPVAAWGLIVAGLLALGAATLMIGLIFILPVLGHATWHLYRRAVPAQAR